MFCGKCGTRVYEGDAFCSRCGTRLEEDVIVRSNYEPDEEMETYYKEYQDFYHNGKGNKSSRNQQKKKRKQDAKESILYVFLGIITVLLIVGIIWGIVTLVKLNKEDKEEYQEPEKTTTEEIDPEISEGIVEEKEIQPEVTETVMPQEIESEKPEIIVTPEATPEATPLPTPIVTEEPIAPEPTQAPTATDNRFIIPDSSSRLLTNADLAGLSEWELRVARNEIYARHGRIFKDSALNDYFRSQSWYVPSISADNFNDQMLSKTELKNAKLITEYEKAHGYN